MIPHSRLVHAYLWTKYAISFRYACRHLISSMMAGTTHKMTVALLASASWSLSASYG